MIRLLQSIWEFAKADFNKVRYSFIVLWVGSLIALNYLLDLENSVIDGLPRGGLRFLGYFFLYSIGYYGAVFIGIINRDLPVFRSQRFWIVSGIGIIIFSIDSGFVFHEYGLHWISPPAQIYGFVYSLLSNASGFATIAVPLFAVNRFIISNRNENLGVNSRELDTKPFVLMLAILAPFVFIAAFNHDLGDYYPTFRRYLGNEGWGIPKWPQLLLYELLYGLDFFNTELFFRGFFIIGMTAVLGKEAVVPMAVFYCTIHFGKPTAETISSLFGGYILGIVAYQTRSIWGGVLIHIGLAWLMELAAFIIEQ